MSWFLLDVKAVDNVRFRAGSSHRYVTVDLLKMPQSQNDPAVILHKSYLARSVRLTYAGRCLAISLWNRR